MLQQTTGGQYELTEPISLSHSTGLLLMLWFLAFTFKNQFKKNQLFDLITLKVKICEQNVAVQ